MSPAFIIIAIVTLFAAAAAMGLRSLVHCALALVVTFAGIAALYLQLDAQFAGFAQILVYIGAVAILVVFAILLTRGAGHSEYRDFSNRWFAGLALAAGVFALLTWAVVRSLPAGNIVSAAPAVTVQTIGAALMSSYVLPLEIVAVLLTVALIGAVIVAMPETSSKSTSAEAGKQRRRFPGS